MSIRSSLGFSGFGVILVMRIPKKLLFPDPMTPQSFSIRALEDRGRQLIFVGDNEILN